MKKKIRRQKVKYKNNVKKFKICHVDANMSIFR